MKKLSLRFFPLFVLLSLASLSLQADPLGDNSRSNATSVLNDTYSPGLPHLAVLKTKNNVFGFVSLGSGTYKISGAEGIFSSINDSKEKVTSQGGGFDGNYLIAGRWGLNVNGGYARTKGEPDRDKKQRSRQDDMYFGLNFAGHYNGTFLYGLGVGKDTLDYSDRNAEYYDTQKRKHDYTPITASVGLHLGGFFAGLGVTSFQENESYKDEDATDENYKMTGSVTVPKLGFGWNSSNRADNFFQVSYSFASLPKGKTKAGTVERGQKQRHNLAFEFQKAAFQTGLYLTNTQTDKMEGIKSTNQTRFDLAFSYAPFAGNLLSLILFADNTEAKMTDSQNGVSLGKPVVKRSLTGATLGYGWAF